MAQTHLGSGDRQPDPDRVGVVVVAALDGDYEIFTEVDFEEGNKFDQYFESREVLGKKYWEYALYTAAHEALPQNLRRALLWPAT